MLVSEVINKPFGLIAELFETYIQDPAASPSEFDPSKHFAELFANPTERNQIPSINDVPIHQLPEKTLVRFRCMIQDTGLGQEIFITAYHNDDSNTGNKKIICHRFMDDPVDMKDGYPNEDHYLSERTAVYCVSPPGETNWTKNCHCVIDLNDAVGRLNIGEKSKAATVHQKYPLPGCDHVAAIIKFYDSQETVRVGQLVEVIGVVGQGFGAHDPTDEFNSHMESLSDIPVLHAITYRSLDPMPFAPECITDVLHQCRDIRPALIDYIASAFRGDKLVAEYVMLQLIARVSKNNGGMKIGQFALNINNFPSASVSAKNKDISLNFDNPASKHTASILESLVAHCVQCPLTLDVLNKMAFSPRSVNENLQAGLLQLVNGTTLLVDETVLTEGTLGDTGVRNVQALANVIQRQHLSYFFPYSHYDLDTDIGVLTLSSTKSILPNNCAIRLEPCYEPEDAEPQNINIPPKETLDLFRMYLQSARSSAYEIPESVSKHIQNDYVNERKAASDKGTSLTSQEDLMMRMDLARLVSLSFGEQVLSKESYDYATRLDKKRRNRMDADRNQVA